jgi:hypothetical protein
MTAIDLNKIQKNVLHIIQKYPEAANDDNVLIDRYWHEIDSYLDDHSLYWNLQRCTKMETITRRRRELYNLGLITYSDEAKEMREEAFINERDAHSTYEAVPWDD